ncbi:MAG: twin-arginine translocase subunit TatC [bacterium]|nr:twin-arginine translocase subunit TatC [bacterium]
MKLKWKRAQENNEKNLSLTGHLEELRYRIVVALLTVGACFLALYPLSKNLLLLIRAPMEEQLYMLAPTEAFVVHLKLAIFGAIIISVPMILYQAWAFVAPGLYSNEKKYTLPFVLVATLFFLLGGLFAYKVILPFGLSFLLGFGGDLVKPIISVSNYVSFVTKMILVFGTIFELPVVVVFLTKMGIVTPELMRKYRKYAIVCAFVLGAILTPPDVFTQALMAGPLIVLYEISIWVCVFLSKKTSEEDDDVDR